MRGKCGKKFPYKCSIILPDFKITYVFTAVVYYYESRYRSCRREQISALVLRVVIGLYEAYDRHVTVPFFKARSFSLYSWPKASNRAVRLENIPEHDAQRDWTTEVEVVQNKSYTYYTSSPSEKLSGLTLPDELKIGGLRYICTTWMTTKLQLSGRISYLTNSSRKRTVLE